ncbi:c-type cytochrome [Phenylobacterium sp.]|uniref:c-type cytochrome n=1 Tax=Phenylobacterium sp. TaxID=1871053 RepID=UPI002FCB2BF9
MADRSWAVLGMAAALAGCAGATGVQAVGGGADPAVQRGQAFAERRCAGCHVVGLDDGPASFGPRFRDLRIRYNALSLQRRFTEISQHGSGEMPPIQIGRREAEDLVAYLETLQAEPPPR